MSKRIYPISYYLIILEEASGMMPKLGLISSSLLEKDKLAKGSGSLGSFSSVGF